MKSDNHKLLEKIQISQSSEFIRSDNKLELIFNKSQNLINIIPCLLFLIIFITIAIFLNQLSFIRPNGTINYLLIFIWILVIPIIIFLCINIINVIRNNKRIDNIIFDKELHKAFFYIKYSNKVVSSEIHFSNIKNLKISKNSGLYGNVSFNFKMILKNNKKKNLFKSIDPRICQYIGGKIADFLQIELIYKQ